jgi:hypothetical protein
MIKLYEKLKVDVALQPGAVNDTNVTGPYFDLAGYDSALFMLETGAIADTKKATIQIMGNTQAGSTGAAAITNYAAEIVGSVKAAIAKIHVNTPDNDDAITVNGLIFAKKATKNDASRHFTTGAELAAQITSQCEGLSASESGGYVTIISADPGKTVISLEDAADKLVPSTVAAVAFVDVPEGAGKRWVAAKVTTDANITCSVSLVRGHARNLPVVHAAAARYPA